MRSIVNIAVIIALTISRSVHCQPQNPRPRTYFVITYPTIDHLVGEQWAAKFLNEICRQPPDNLGIVRGAIEYGRTEDPDSTGLGPKFRLWDWYMENGMGQYGSQDRNFAWESWDTFAVKCGFVASSTWAMDTKIQNSMWVQNRNPEDWWYEVPISVTVGAFDCISGIPFWRSLSQSSPDQSIAPEFLKRLSGLPYQYINQWVGTQYSTDVTGEYRPRVKIRGYYEAMVSATMVERTVMAYLSIEVVEYWFGEGERRSAPTWKGLDGYNHIYTTRGGNIMCSGLVKILPDTSVQLIEKQQPLF
jgi:hypothetical protein